MGFMDPTNSERQEMPTPGLFRVEVQNPDKLYLAVRNFDETRKPRINLGILVPESGLFSKIESNLMFYPQFQGGYDISTQPEYQKEHALKSYWTDTEITQLQSLLASQYKNEATIRHEESPYKINLMVIDNPTLGTTFFIRLGWRTEREKWIHTMKTIDDLRDQPNLLQICFPDGIEGVTKGTGPLPNDHLFISTHRLGAGPNQPPPDTTIAMEKQDDFVRKMQGFGVCVERSINAVAQIKGIPQTGRLILS